MKHIERLGEKAFDGEYIIRYTWLKEYIALKNHVRRLEHTRSMHGDKWVLGMLRYYAGRVSWHLEEKPGGIKLPDDDLLYSITRVHGFITKWLQTR